MAFLICNFIYTYKLSTAFPGPTFTNITIAPQHEYLLHRMSPKLGNKCRNYQNKFTDAPKNVRLSLRRFTPKSLSLRKFFPNLKQHVEIRLKGHLRPRGKPAHFRDFHRTHSFLATLGENLHSLSAESVEKYERYG
jgi:hypothetical protein